MPQAMPLRIFQERQQSRCPRAAAPLRTPAKCIGYFLTDPNADGGKYVRFSLP